MHGELDLVYERLQQLERERNIRVDLLLCCGDFQAVRDEQDLEDMAVPEKYKKMMMKVDIHKVVQVNIHQHGVEKQMKV